MVYRPSYPWYIDPPTHGISTPLPMVFLLLSMIYRPPTYGVSTPYPWYIDPLPMLCRSLYPWYINPPTHGILTPLPMAH